MYRRDWIRIRSRRRKCFRRADHDRRSHMNISRRFIEYPIMTTLLMAALVIFGIFGYASLPVSELPNVDFPTIQVGASLAGADPITMAATIATPLESAFSV